MGSTVIAMADLRPIESRAFKVDGAIAIAGLALAAFYLFILHQEVTGTLEFSYWRALGVMAAILLPLTFRRRWPLTVLAVVTVPYVAVPFHVPAEGIFSSLGFFVALYSAGAYGQGRRATLVRVAAVVVNLVTMVWALAYVDIEPENAQVSDTVWTLFWFTVTAVYLSAAWLLGDATRTRLRHERELAQRADELAAAHATIAAQAVQNERVRVARELHDVLAHHVSVMGVQAGAARRVLERSPEQAADAMRSIEEASRTAVAELHRLLGFLHREGDIDEGTAPQPSLRRVDALITQMRAAGLDVKLQVEGLPPSLPAVVDLSAYRVVQEALTNTLKHAGPGASATVTLAYENDELRVEVVDDGRGRQPSALGAVVAGAGRGLVGMRERVGLTGGALTVGRRFDGGFGVAATFPLASP